MRLLLDANLSPRVAQELRDAGYDVVHVADIDLLTATDAAIFERAAADGLVVVTADSDFGASRVGLNETIAPLSRSPTTAGRLAMSNAAWSLGGSSSAA